MNRILLKPPGELFSIRAPPRTFERAGHDFDHDHFIAFDSPVGSRPRALCGRPQIGRHAVVALDQLRARFRKVGVMRRGVSVIATRKQDLNEKRHVGLITRRVREKRLG